MPIVALLQKLKHLCVIITTNNYNKLYQLQFSDRFTATEIETFMCHYYYQ